MITPENKQQANMMIARRRDTLRMVIEEKKILEEELACLEEYVKMVNVDMDGGGE